MNVFRSGHQNSARSNISMCRGCRIKLDALATMASMMDGSKEDEARPIVLKQKEEPAYCMTIEEDKGMNEEGECI